MGLSAPHDSVYTTHSSLLANSIAHSSAFDGPDIPTWILPSISHSVNTLPFDELFCIALHDDDNVSCCGRVIIDTVTFATAIQLLATLNSPLRPSIHCQVLSYLEQVLLVPPCRSLDPQTLAIT